MDKQFTIEELKKKNRPATLIYYEKGSLMISTFRPDKGDLLDLVKVDARLFAINLDMVSAMALTDPRGINLNQINDVLMFIDPILDEDPEEDETE